MKEIKIEKLPHEIIDYVKQNVEVFKSSVNRIPLCYARSRCHINSVLLCDDITSNNNYSCELIEGILVCSDGFACPHCWNVVRDDENELHYFDVTMDAIATDEERAMGKKYFAIKEISKEKMKERIANGQALFSDETLKAIEEYYAQHPKKKTEYKKWKAIVDGEKNLLPEG